MNLVRSLLFNLIFYPGTLVFVLAGLAIFPVGERPMRVVVHGWARFHQLLTRHLLEIEDRFEGEWPAGQVLIVMKHQSMYEAVATLRLFETPVVVMKNQLSDMPLFGWLTRRYGVIGVDREAGASALRTMMAEAKAAIAGGRPVIIFPEGTRVPYGESPPLQPGFAGLYRALGLPVVPVSHDVGRLWHKGFLKRSGTVHFKVGEVIPSGLKRDEIEARVHTAINALN